jgi:threonine/homoserine/homoserine lactone efflux protein
MPSSSTFAVYLLAALLMLLIPGPSVLYVVSQGLRQGRRAGVTAVVGGSTGALVQVAAATAGLSSLLLSSSIAFTIVKFVGAAYLVYLGVTKLLGRGDGALPENPAPRSPLRLFADGVVVNTLNPKLALFFMAFLPQFVDPARGPVTLQIAIFGVTFVALGFFTDSAYAMLAGTIGPWLWHNVRFRRGERYVVGTTFIGVGVVSALTPAHRGSG